MAIPISTVVTVVCAFMGCVVFIVALAIPLWRIGCVPAPDMKNVVRLVASHHIDFKSGKMDVDQVMSEYTGEELCFKEGLFFIWIKYKQQELSVSDIDSDQPYLVILGAIGMVTSMFTAVIGSIALLSLNVGDVSQRESKSRTKLGVVVFVIGGAVAFLGMTFYTAGSQSNQFEQVLTEINTDSGAALPVTALTGVIENPDLLDQQSFAHYLSQVLYSTYGFPYIVAWVAVGFMMLAALVAITTHRKVILNCKGLRTVDDDEPLTQNEMSIRADC